MVSISVIHLRQSLDTVVSKTNLIVLSIIYKVSQKMTLVVSTLYVLLSKSLNGCRVLIFVCFLGTFIKHKRTLHTISIVLGIYLLVSTIPSISLSTNSFFFFLLLLTREVCETCGWTLKLVSVTTTLGTKILSCHLFFSLL